jgi:anti-sigma factor RsiW
MRHASARRHLPELLDGTLPPEIERSVREHAALCGRCRRRLEELELCDRLVARLPLAVVPLAVAPAAGEPRLERLARWGAPPPHPRHSPLRAGFESLAVVAAAAALAGVVAIAGVNRWVPAPEPAPSGLTQVAYVMPAGGPY